MSSERPPVRPEEPRSSHEGKKGGLPEAIAAPRAFWRLVAKAGPPPGIRKAVLSPVTELVMTWRVKSSSQQKLPARKIQGQGTPDPLGQSADLLG